MPRSKERSSAVAEPDRKQSASSVSPSPTTTSRNGASERAALEMKLREATDRLACFEEHSPLAVIEWSPADLRVLRWSDAATRLFGWSADEALGKRADELQLLQLEEAQTAFPALAKSAQGKYPRSISKHRNLRRDGSVVDCEWYNSAVGAPGAVRSIVSLVLDVTERERSQEALCETKSQLASVIENIPHGVTTIDREWRYLDVSPQAARELRKTREELLGRSMWEVFPHEGDELRAHCERAWRERTPVSFEHYSSALGRWYETFLYPFASGLTIQGHDITDRKRAEEAMRESELRLRTVLENTPEGYSIYDADRRYEYMNPVGLKLGNCKLEDVVGKRDEELWPAQTPLFLPQLIRAYETGLRQRFELETTSLSGELFNAVVTMVPLKDSQGKVRQVVTATYDLTERKRHERALLEVDRRKNDFLALLSHELRNPLTPIRYSLFILDRVAPQSEQAERAKAIINRQVEHMVRLVDDLLDVTRISRGKIRLQRDRFDLGALVRRTAEDYSSLFATNCVELVTEVSQEPMMVEGDPARIAQVIGNLLQNAAKFTPTRGRVSLTLRAHEAGRAAIIAVRDTGVGISAETLPRLFQPFQQAEESLDRTKGGLGLGLALVKALVEMHGGDVEARSEGLGTGAEFIVSLPVDASDAPGMTRPHRSSASLARRVLIVEDNIDSARTLREVLQLEGHDVEIAYNGSDALDKARRFGPEVVFCDIGLPGMDGYEIAKAFRSDQQLRSAYLVALTGYAMPDDRAKAQAAGFDEHLTKPPGLDKLREVLAEASFMSIQNRTDHAHLSSS